MGGGISKGKAAATAVIFQNRISKSRRFIDAHVLLASVESGAIALLSGRYLVELQRRGGRLQRRQDLPPGAFIGIEKLRKLVAALREDWGRLFVAISYRFGDERVEALAPVCSSELHSPCHSLCFNCRARSSRQVAHCRSP